MNDELKEAIEWLTIEATATGNEYAQRILVELERLQVELERTEKAYAKLKQKLHASNYNQRENFPNKQL